MSTNPALDNGSKRVAFSGSLNFDFQTFSQLSPLATDESLSELRRDCRSVYQYSMSAVDDDVASISSSDYHTSGMTFFHASNAPPRCSIEALALHIFRMHTQNAIFDPDISGAEWWTQVW